MGYRHSRSVPAMPVEAEIAVGGQLRHVAAPGGVEGETVRMLPAAWRFSNFSNAEALQNLWMKMRVDVVVGGRIDRS